ncbi:hypothetical protein ACMD2_17672 [Ananas comosus]|uniref:Uncharacterized protein n=1 Tax=Ananas comosus TaxID=4615 RepID=A0A199W4A2_ANACO|nr:hypothetical protein ACMD2_17672 [Ananas comosus]
MSHGGGDDDDDDDDEELALRRRPRLTSTRHEALALYCDSLRATRFFAWPDARGVPWRDVASVPTCAASSRRHASSGTPRSSPSSLLVAAASSRRPSAGSSTLARRWSTPKPGIVAEVGREIETPTRYALRPPASLQDALTRGAPKSPSSLLANPCSNLRCSSRTRSETP